MSAWVSHHDSESEDEDEVEVKVVWQRTSIPRYIVLFCFFMIGATYGTILYFGLTQPGPDCEGSAGQKWRNFLFPNRVSEESLKLISGVCVCVCVCLYMFNCVYVPSPALQ